MAKKSTQNRLKEDSERASRIEAVLVQTGWQDIVDIVQDKYNVLMDRLLEKENAEARGGINAITEIMDDISHDLQFGRNAREKYRKKFLATQPQGE